MPIATAVPDGVLVSVEERREWKLEIFLGFQSVAQNSRSSG
jgi:hypothetical protein